MDAMTVPLASANDGEEAMPDQLPAPIPGGEFLLYQSEDGRTRLQVRVQDQTVWLPQRLIADLYQVSVKTVNEHLMNIYDEGELAPAPTIRKFRIVQQEGRRQVERLIDHYNLDAILAVGYRVRSLRGTQFRQWATAQLRELLVKGFVLDDDRLKQAGGGNYFEELLARIRDIRSSERVFWRKVLDIYSTSIDYDPAAESSLLFFKTVQNKMHWAVHGQTAAEVIHHRADATKPHMGLTSWAGDRPRRPDVSIAKNYLTHDELEALNLIVSAYLDFAELQAHSRRPMHMVEWIVKLDDFLRLSERDVLSHAGKVSHEQAQAKAEVEFERFRQAQAALPQPVDQHFDQAIEELKRIEGEKKRTLPSKEPKKRARKKKPKPPEDDAS
jgi:hypothetical protein